MEKKKCKDACSKDRGKSGKVKMATNKADAQHGSKDLRSKRYFLTAKFAAR